MAEQTTSDNRKKTIETVQKLLALADDDANEEEARSAALKAVKLMRQNDLQIVSGEDLQAAERVVSQARAMVQDAKKDVRKNMAIGALFGYLLGGKKF